MDREARSPASTPPGGEVQRHRTRLKQQDITWPPQDTQTRSRPIMGKDGPSDSALAAARGWRLRRTAADRHAARCASRALCSGGAPRRYSPSKVVVDEPVSKPDIIHGGHLAIFGWTADMDKFSKERF